MGQSYRAWGGPLLRLAQRRLRPSHPAAGCGHHRRRDCHWRHARRAKRNPSFL